MPTRSPVNGPGPRPTTTWATSASRTPAESRQRCTSGTSCSTWAIRSVTRSLASTSVPWASPTVTSVDVSRARTRPWSGTSCFLVRRRRFVVEGHALREVVQVLGGPALPDRSEEGETAAVRVVQQVDLEPVVPGLLDEAAAPLDDGDAGGCAGVEVEVVQLAGSAQPVGVDVHQGGPAGASGVHAGQHEGGRDDGARDAEPLPEALRQGGLAGTQLAGEDQEVAGPYEVG